MRGPVFDRRTKQLWDRLLCGACFVVYGSQKFHGVKGSQIEAVGWVADLRTGDPAWSIPVHMKLLTHA